jgi:hypothetical protein
MEILHILLNHQPRMFLFKPTTMTFVTWGRGNTLYPIVAALLVVLVVVLVGVGVVLYPVVLIRFLLVGFVLVPLFCGTKLFLFHL